MILFLIRYCIEYYITKISSEKSVKKMQIRKVNKLLSHACENSVFYKNLYKDLPKGSLKISCLEDLQKLPIVTKDDFKKFPIEDVLTTQSTQNLIVRSTSGSTGKPFDIYSNRKEYFTGYFRTFFSLYYYNPFTHFALIGVVGQKEVIEKKSFLYYAQKYFKLFRREAYNIFTPPAEIVEKLRDRKINILSSTPTGLKVVIDELKKTNEKLKIGYVVLSGETLMDDVRDEIKEYLQAKIINVYGCMEHPSLAWTNPNEESFSYAPNSIILEYVNHIEINGELYGELVITNLVNKTMPFIRYNIGDHVKIIDQHKKMGKIIGRIDDVITLKNGTKLFRLQVWSIFSSLKECSQYKILQKKDGKLYFQAICKKGLDKRLVQEKIENIWKNSFGESPVEIEFLDEIPINKKTGKFKNIEVEV